MFKSADQFRLLFTYSTWMYKYSETQETVNNLQSSHTTQNGEGRVTKDESRDILQLKKSRNKQNSSSSSFSSSQQFLENQAKLYNFSMLFSQFIWNRETIYNVQEVMRGLKRGVSNFRSTKPVNIRKLWSYGDFFPFLWVKNTSLFPHCTAFTTLNLLKIF